MKKGRTRGTIKPTRFVVIALLFAVLAVAGITALLGTFAAGLTVSLEAESGIKAGVVSKADSTASGGEAVSFGGGTTPPNPNPSPVPVGSKVVFVGNFDDGTGKSIGNFDSAKKSYSLQVVNDGPDHPTAGRFELHSGEAPSYGGNRTEFKVNSAADVKSGDERWYEMSVKVPADFSNPKPWFIIMQWHAGSGSPPLALEINESGQLLFTNNRNGAKTILGPLKKGQWMKLVLHVKFSSSSGMAEAWIDGVKAPNVHSHPNMASSSNYLKYGIYRQDQSAVHVVYHDDLRITAP